MLQLPQLESVTLQIHPGMTLASLNLWEHQLDIGEPGESLTQRFNQEPLLPGILITEDGQYLGMISRRKFFEKMSRQYALELFSKRPISCLYSALNIDTMELAAETCIMEAAPLALKRSAEAVYEPIVMSTATGDYGVINFQDLLVLYSEIHGVVLKQLQQSRRQVMATKTDLRQLQQDYNQALHTEKMASLGQLVAGMAHEINNPINFIHGNLHCAKDYAQDLLTLIHLYQQYYPNPPTEIVETAETIDLTFLEKDFTSLLRSMSMGTERIRDIVHSMRNFSRLDESEQKAANLHEGIDNTLTILQHRLLGSGKQASIEIEKDYGELPLVTCNPGQLNQVFMNIIVNAIDELIESRPPQPKISIVTRAEPDGVLIAISDNGSGISTKKQQSIFTPFFTTKPVGQGTGMGLSISYKIIESHNGQLTCDSSSQQGTTFNIKIPCQV